jgi:hypothetical protein
MISRGDDTIRNVYGLSETEEKSIMAFLQGAVYCWCKNIFCSLVLSAILFKIY